MLEMGLVVGIGIAFLYFRLSARRRVWVNSNPMLIDLAVFVVLNVLHWGTFSGTMVAAVGALFCSMVLTLTRKWHGYIENGRYIRGWVDLGDQL